MLNSFGAYLNRDQKNTIKTILNSLKSTLLFSMNSQTTPHLPPPFDPTQPSSPISYPIKTLQDLATRAYFKSFHYPFNKSSVPLRNGESLLPNRRRILVCHDMAGGYTDNDKWVQGGGGFDAFGIWHWYLMDVFVYFSHDLVTLPPPCWSNAAHRHGVKVLGTFIIEWDAGKVIANNLLETKESALMYAERLTELAVALGFDGWLINMEVELDIRQIPNLKEFVNHLTHTMHSSKPGSLVIWYDSVTIDGKLSWQDQLNDKNKPFFDICDGIFVNYTWKEDYPKMSAAVAGNRNFDVYMGIDVFGRGTFGGGQWMTNVALDVIKKDDVSAAIFAPGWLYETKQPPDFQSAQNRWWSLIEESWGISQNYPKALPFYSNFDQGRGFHVSIDGKQVSNVSWNNISCESFQPFLEYPGDPNPNTIQVDVNFKEASYSGGGNITFRGYLKDDAYFTTRLFLGELQFGTLPVLFTYSVKSNESSLVGLSLDFTSLTLDKKSVLLASSGNTLQTMNQFSSKFGSIIMSQGGNKMNSETEWVIQESSIAMDGHTLTGIHAVCYKSKPHIYKHELATIGSDPSEYYALLGHIEVKTSADNLHFPPSAAWLIEGQYIKWALNSQGSKTISVKIIWSLKDGNAPLFPKYNIYVVKQPSISVKEMPEYLGVAQVEAFYISELVVPSGSSSLNFIIQVCGVNETLQKLVDSPSILLPAEGL